MLVLCVRSCDYGELSARERRRCYCWHLEIEEVQWRLGHETLLPILYNIN